MQPDPNLSSGPVGSGPAGPRSRRLPYMTSGYVFPGQLPDSPSRQSIVSKFLITLINAYRALRSGRPSPCRFYPTCSAYGLEAISNFGAMRGGWLTAKRIGRCRPGGPHGIDLVPEPRATFTSCDLSSHKGLTDV